MSRFKNVLHMLLELCHYISLFSDDEQHYAQLVQDVFDLSLQDTLGIDVDERSVQRRQVDGCFC